MDLRLNSDFDIELDDRNDLPVVEGRQAFEQRVIIRTTAYFHEIVGTVTGNNLVSLLELQAERVANDTPELERTVQIEAARSADQPNTVEMTIIYDIGDSFTFSITE